jgi:hypothetical protein
MNDQPHIKLGMPEDVPERFRELITIDDNTGVIVLFVAHVPAAVLAGKTYQPVLFILPVFVSAVSRRAMREVGARSRRGGSPYPQLRVLS